MRSRAPASAGLAQGMAIAQPGPMTQLERDTVRTFLSSAFFAEDEAMPTVNRLLAQPCDAEERTLLESYAAEEEGHAQLIRWHFEQRAEDFGKPFWIQRLFRLATSRATMLQQMYVVEVLAATFYGAMASHTKDREAQALIRRLLRDEARHIRLARELLARELARTGFFGRLKAKLFAAGFIAGVAVTARVQAKQLRPVLGETGFRYSKKIVRVLLADLPVIFRSAGSSSRSLGWWFGPLGSPFPGRALRPCGLTASTPAT